MSVEENFSVSQIKSLNEAGLFGSAQILVGCQLMVYLIY
jgi:hypothetical protein